MRNNSLIYKYFTYSLRQKEHISQSILDSAHKARKVGNLVLDRVIRCISLALCRVNKRMAVRRYVSYWAFSDWALDHLRNFTR